MNDLEDLEISITFWNLSGSPGLPPQDDLILSTFRPLKAVRARSFLVIVNGSLLDRVQRLLPPLAQPFKLVTREQLAPLGARSV